MKDVSNQSLSELKTLYTRKIEYWEKEKLAAGKKIEQCRREIDACEAKLRHILALIGGPAAPVAAAPKKVASGKTRGRKKRTRNRKSPVKAATLQALRNRPGERLTTKQLLTAIRKDTRKRVSRQSVNVNLGLLENEGRVHKYPAPRGSGSRFVYTIVAGA